MDYLKKYRLLAILLLLLVTTIWALVWFSGHGRLQIKGISTESTISILNQSDLKNNSTITKSNVSKTLPKGSYEVMVSSKKGKYFQVIKVNGFLKSSVINANVQEESSRQIVSNGGANCLDLFNQQVVSYLCGGTLQQSYNHVPSTEDQPGYIQTNMLGPGYEGTIEGVVSMPSKRFMLLHSEYSDENPEGHYLLWQEVGLSKINRIKLDRLSFDSSYKLVIFGEKLLIHSIDFKESYEYDPANGILSEFNLGVGVSDGNNSPSHIQVINNKMVGVFYLSNVGDDKPTLEAIRKNEDGTFEKFNLDGNYLPSSKFCLTDYLCAIGDKGVEIYQIAGPKLKYIFRITSVNAVENFIDQILVFRPNDILKINIKDNRGIPIYSYSPFDFQGYYMGNEGILISVKKDGFKPIILINPSKTANNLVDKSILNLVEDPLVKNVSVDKRRVFVVPNYGDPVIDETTSRFGYNQETMKSVKQQLEEKAKIIRNYGVGVIIL